MDADPDSIVTPLMSPEGGRMIRGGANKKKSAAGGRPNVSRLALQKEKCRRRAAPKKRGFLNWGS